MSDFEFDMSEVEAFATILDAAPAKALKDTREVVQKAALNIKKGMQDDFGGIAHAPYFPSAITYDTRVTHDGIEAEIGPDKSKPQGPLGNILAFGTVKNGPVADITRSLRAQIPELQEYLGRVGADAIDG